MICFAYNSPISISLILDRSKYSVHVSIEDKELKSDLKFIKSKSTKPKVLLIDSYARLKELASKSKKLKKVKVALFESALVLANNGLDPIDSYLTDEGIWVRKSLVDVDINSIVDKVHGGVEMTKSKKIDKKVKKGKGKVEEVEKVVPLAVETESELGKAVEALVHESETQESASHIRTTFLTYAIGWLPEKHLTKAIKKLEKEGYTKKKIKAALKAVESSLADSVCSAILDTKIFKTEPEVAVEDCGCDPKDFEYVGEFVNIKKLKLDDAEVDEENIPQEVLAKRVEGGQPIETTSKFGDAVEKFLAKVAYPPHNKELRELFCQYAVGMVEEKPFLKALKAFEPYPITIFKRILKEADKEVILTPFNRVVAQKVSPEVALEYDKCPQEDWDYVNSILPVEKVKKRQLLFHDSIDPMEET